MADARLWADKLGQISLATTTLFWGVSGNLRYIVLAWAGAALGYSTTQASSLVGVVALGTAVGAVVASMRMRLDQATRVMPLGIAMGVLVACALGVFAYASGHAVFSEYGNVGTDFDYIAAEGFGWVNASFAIGLARSRNRGTSIPPRPPTRKRSGSTVAWRLLTSASRAC